MVARPTDAAISCPSCGAAGARCLGPIAPGISFAGRPLETPRSGGRLYACDRCALWFRWPQPSTGELTRLYQDAAEGHWSAPAEERIEWQVARRWLDEHIGHGALLDVGCFDGRFLEFMGGNWSRYGIEVNARAAAEAAGRSVDVIGDDVDALAHVSESFDAITAIDVIEHVQDPLRALRLMAEAVRPGGAVVFATGNTQAPSWRLMQNQYWYCTIPEHLSFVGEEWAAHAARTLGLEIAYLERYARDADRSWAKPAFLSLLLKAAPGLFGALRSLGLSDVDVKGHAGLKTYPPVWSAAKDHFLVAFIRSAQASSRRSV